MSLIKQLLVETVGPETAGSILKNAINTISLALQEMMVAKQDHADNPKVARMIVTRMKARWVQTHYLANRVGTSAGLQQVAEYFMTHAKQDKSRAIFRQIANLRISAMKESGNSKIFDTVVKLFVPLSELTADEHLRLKLDRIRQLYERLGAGEDNKTVVDRPKRQKLGPTVHGSDKIHGEQNQQAEQMFQQIVGSLPKTIAAQVREETRRMNPSAKMQYLKRIMASVK